MSVDGVLTVCPGDRISVTCTHNNTAGITTRWELPDRSTCTVIHDGSTPNCDPFTLTMISDFSGPTLSSTIEITVSDRMLDSETIICIAGISATTSPVVGSVNISVPSELKS